jgi:hypothetical protein
MKASLLENLELPFQYTVEEICRSLETNLRPLIKSVQKEVDIAIYFFAPSTQYRDKIQMMSQNYNNKLSLFSITFAQSFHLECQITNGTNLETFFK